MFSEDIGLSQLCFPLIAYYLIYLNHIPSRLIVKKFLAGEVSLNNCQQVLVHFWVLNDFWFGANQFQIRGLLAEVKNRDGRDGGHLSFSNSLIIHQVQTKEIMTVALFGCLILISINVLFLRFLFFILD